MIFAQSMGRQTPPLHEKPGSQGNSGEPQGSAHTPLMQVLP
jgi:hypothetical protein